MHQDNFENGKKAWNYEIYAKILVWKTDFSFPADAQWRLSL